MNSRFERLAELFELCSDQTPEEIRRILDRECAGDSDLRQAVERLLASDAAPHTLQDVVHAVGQILGSSTATGAGPDNEASIREPEFDVPERIGRYEVTGILGYGGMGTVYSAQDPDLGRSVAIKVLPGAWGRGDGSDVVRRDPPERLASFRREAQLLARLTHPNIAVLHSLEESEGRAFLTMEHIVGETLDERLRREPATLSESISWGRQIAGALEAAHAKGVIHRDLKPSNVMISSTGVLKVLDFGLAEVVAPKVVPTIVSRMTPPVATTSAPTAADSSARSTQSVPLPPSFAIPPAGSPGYISPEQLRGAPGAESADIWGWGCVLYECLTGRMAFPGTSPEERLQATLRHETPEAIFPPGVPPKLSQLVLACLSPDPDQRPASVSVLLARLREVSRRPDTRRRSWMTGVLALAALILIGTVWLVWETRDTGRAELGGKPPSTAMETSVPRRATRSGFVKAMDLARSGDRLTYVTNHGDVVVVDLDEDEERILTTDPTIQAIAWSPDEAKLLVYTLGREVDRTFLISTVDGTMDPIGPSTFQGRCWSPDGREVLGVMSRTKVSQGPAFLLELETGKLDTLALPRAFTHVDYDWSRGTGAMLFVGSYPGGSRGAWVLDTAHGELRLIADLKSDLARWSPNGQSVLTIKRDEWRNFLNNLPTRPDAMREPLSFLELPTSSSALRVSDDGSRVVTLSQLPRSTLWRLVRPDDVSEFEAAALWGGTVIASDPKIRPGGGEVAFIAGTTESVGILRVAIEGGDPSELVEEGPDKSFLSWSPDGERLAYGVVDGGLEGIRWVAAQAEGRGQVPGVDGRTYLEWMPDGRILYHPSSADNQNYRFVDPSTGEQSPLFEPAREGTLFQVAASTDGTQLAVAGARGGRSEIDVWLISPDDGSEELLFEGAAAPVAWSPDDEWVYLTREIRESRFVGETVGEVLRVRVADRHVEVVASLPPGDLRRWTDVDISPDGRTIVCALSQDQRDVWVIDLPPHLAIR